MNVLESAPEAPPVIATEAAPADVHIVEDIVEQRRPTFAEEVIVPVDLEDETAAYQDFQMGELTMAEVVATTPVGTRGHVVRSAVRLYLPAERRSFTPDISRAAMDLVRTRVSPETQIQSGVHYFDYDTYRRWGAAMVGRYGTPSQQYIGKIEEAEA